MSSPDGILKDLLLEIKSYKHSIKMSDLIQDRLNKSLQSYISSLKIYSLYARNNYIDSGLDHGNKRKVISDIGKI